MSKDKKIPTKEEIKTALEQRHTKVVQDKLSNAHVAVCGLGGLGSNVAVALARCGIGRLHLIDFDYVDITNINRQQYSITQLGRPKTAALKEELLAINPYLEIKTDLVKLTEENIGELLKEEHYICEAFDAPEQKAMLTNYILEHFPKKILVGASGMAGYGNSNLIQTKKVFSNYYLCGDGVLGIEQCQSLMAPRVMLCAAHQANQILELIVQQS